MSIEKALRHIAIAWSLLVFCMTSLIAAALGAGGAWALVAFMGTAFLYLLILRVDFFNEIEGAIACEILLVLLLLLGPALQRIRDFKPHQGASAPVNDK